MNHFIKRLVSLLILCVWVMPMVTAQKSAFPAGKIESTVRVSGLDEAHWPKSDRSSQSGLFVPKADRVKAFQSKLSQFPWRAKAAPEFRGIQIFADSWDPYGTKPYGVYEYSTRQPAIANPVFLEDIMFFNGNAVKAEDALYGTYFQTNSDGYIILLIHLKYNAVSFELEGSIIREMEDGVPLDCSGIATDLAYDPISGNIYGCFLNSNQSNYHFGILNTGKMISNNICSVLDPYFGMAVDPTGQLYAITKKGDFGKVDKSTGEFSLIKKTGLHSENVTSASIDPVSGQFYYIVCYENSNSELYSIDCISGEAALVYEMPDDQEVVGMWFPDYTAEATAPERPIIKSIDFPGQSLEGTVTLATPTLLFDETPPSAGSKLSYSIYANGVQVQSGSGLEFGRSYKVNVSVPESGMYDFHVVVTNENGASPESKPVSKWIGVDSPSAPADVKAEYSGGNMQLTWDKVTIGQHQGAVGNVTYSISSAIDGKLVADGITDTSYSFPLEAPIELTVYQYYVKAISDGLESNNSKSNMVSLGAFLPPYHETWATLDDVALWTRLDGDDDGKGWVVTTLEDGEVAGAWCTSHSYPVTEPNNDWLITPPINLEAGKVYTLNYNLMTGNYSGANIAIYVGTSPTIEGMTQVILPEEHVVYNNWSPVETTFTSELSGPCYIGIQCCTGQWMSTLFFNDFTISTPHNPGAPSAATGLDVTVPYDGECKGTLTYTAPTLAIDGSELSSLTRIEVLVNNTVINVDDNPVAGKESSIEYDAPKSGQYEFAVICYNNEGEGETARCKAFLGINYPAPPSNAQIVEISDGVVDLSWDETTSDIAGNPLNPALVTYDIYGYNEVGEIVLKIRDVEGTTVTGYQAVPQDYQGFVRFFVVARTEAGSTLEAYNGLLSFASAATPQIACGTPFSVPYNITFANGQVNTLLSVDENEGWGATWGVYTSADMGFLSRNNDNGFMVLSGSYGQQSVFTGKIEVSVENPVLNYWYLGRGSNQQMDVYVICDSERQYVGNVVMNAPSGEWAMASVDLAAYSGKVVQLYLTGILSWGGPSLVIDDIYVGNPLKNEMAAVSISAPATISTETEFNIEYTVKNWGSDIADDYSVSLYADGNLVETIENDLPELASGESYTGYFSNRAYTLFESGTYEFSFVVNIPNDEDLTNNGSQPVKVKVSNTDYPAVEISGEVKNVDGHGQVNLKWETPAIIVSDFDVTESFESEAYPSWTIEDFGPWTLRNYNPSSTYGLTNFIDYPNRCQPQGFTLFDYPYMVNAGFYDEWDAFEPYEGDRYMVAFAHTSGANDAWLISNNLGGMPQQVTFFARSCDSSHQYAETMEAYYSLSGMDKSDFIRLEIPGYEWSVPYDWTEYTLDLPEGVQYFAIVSTGYNKLMLGIDNISYKYTSPFVSLEVEGYNVYCNGQLLTEQPIKQLSYVDTLEKDGTYDYCVSVVYNNGKSAPSNNYEAVIDFTAVKELAYGTPNVRTEGNRIIVEKAVKAAIVTADGKVIYSGPSPVKVDVGSGVYVVTADDAITKVIVK